MVAKKKLINSGIYNKGEITFDDVIASVKGTSNITEAGAILSFTGIVRNTSEDGKLVNGLKIDAYDELANQTIEIICSDIKKKYRIIDIRIIHLKGDFDISDDLVYVVVASAHRNDGFEALRTAVERYKHELTVWKKEDFLNGNSKWVH
ncbi:MAG: molybdenum cofactor biosynthesis protein MoaE [Candidatus Hodarchaeota archaeon]